MYWDYLISHTGPLSAPLTANLASYPTLSVNIVCYSVILWMGDYQLLFSPLPLEAFSQNGVVQKALGKNGKPGFWKLYKHDLITEVVVFLPLSSGGLVGPQPDLPQTHPPPCPLATRKTSHWPNRGQLGGRWNARSLSVIVQTFATKLLLPHNIWAVSIKSSSKEKAHPQILVDGFTVT